MQARSFQRHTINAWSADLSTTGELHNFAQAPDNPPSRGAWVTTIKSHRAADSHEAAPGALDPLGLAERLGAGNGAERHDIQGPTD